MLDFNFMYYIIRFHTGIYLWGENNRRLYKSERVVGYSPMKILGSLTLFLGPIADDIKNKNVPEV